jgi:hypothetical protein
MAAANRNGGILMDKKTAREIAEKLLSINESEKVPEGWFTVRDLAKIKDVSYSHAGRICRELSADDKLETRKFKINTPRGFYPIQHYKFP